jgi:hypothetical protein
MLPSPTAPTNNGSQESAPVVLLALTIIKRRTHQAHFERRIISPKRLAFRGSLPFLSHIVFRRMIIKSHFLNKNLDQERQIVYPKKKASCPFALFLSLFLVEFASLLCEVYLLLRLKGPKMKRA